MPPIELEIAKKYLSSNDHESEISLSNLGSRATPFVAQAFQEYVRDFGGGPAKPMLRKFTQDGYANGMIAEEQFKRQMREIEEMSDEPGVSMALMFDAHEKMKLAWQIIDKMRAVEALVQLIYPGMDPLIRCAAALIFSGSEKLNTSTIKLLEKILPNLMGLDMRQPGNEIPFGIVMNILAKAERNIPREMINKIVQQKGISSNQLWDMYINSGLDFIRKNGAIRRS